MKTKLLVIFSLIVIIPTVTIICLGINLTRSESNQVKEKFRELLTEKLHGIEKDVNKILKERELQLLPLTEIRSVNIESLRDLSAKSPYINQVFILNTKRELVYPALNAKGLSSTEQSFHKRTLDIWESGETFYRPNETIPQIDSRRGHQNIVRQEEQQIQQKKLSQSYIAGSAKDSFISGLASSPSVKPESGWYTWYRAQGLNFILWKRNANDLLIGLELNRSRLLSDVIASLPDSNQEKELIILKNAASELYSWGNYNKESGETPKAQISLTPPLQSWTLSYFTTDKAFTGNYSKSITFNYALGGIILATLLVGLCTYFFRENNRQLRESSQKVNFVNQVSHELKSPLTNIRLYAELLKKDLIPKTPEPTINLE